MISKISFKNYKLFKDRQELELKPLTILIGKNSSGKSSITKLLPLIEASLKSNSEIPISPENNGVELGREFRDLIYGRYDIGSLEIRFETDEKDVFTVEIASGVRVGDIPRIIRWNFNDSYDFKYQDLNQTYINLVTGKEKKLKFRGFKIDDSNYSDFQDKLSLTTNYIGPYRAIPSRSIDTVATFQFRNNQKLGINGSGAYPYLIVDALLNKNKISSRLSAWYRDKFEGWGIDANIENRNYFELELVRENPEIRINFKDVGQGMVQILPLILSSFIPSNSEEINIFEQPELHLHPSAHGDIAERFAKSTKELGKRYLIETHSQNFILRLRRLIAEGVLDKDDLVIYYLDYDEEQAKTDLKKINIDKNGEVDYWPTQIFNESLEEVLAIRKAQKQS